MIKKLGWLLLFVIFSCYWAFFSVSWLSLEIHHAIELNEQSCQDNSCCSDEKDDCIQECLTKIEVLSTQKTSEKKQYCLFQNIILNKVYNKYLQIYQYSYISYLPKKEHTLFLEQYIGIQKITW